MRPGLLCACARHTLRVLSTQGETVTVTNDTPSKSPLQRFFELEPALLRGILLALVAIVAQVIRSEVDLQNWVDLIINLYTAISAFLATWWTRTVVIPTSKVLAFKSASGAIKSGDATIDPTDQAAVEDTLNAAVSTQKEAA